MVERQGFEYIRFHRQDVLVLESNGEPIRKGTGMTQPHLDIALKLQEFKDRAMSHNRPEAFQRLLRIREIRMRRLARESFLESIRSEEAAKERIGYLGLVF